MVSTSSTLPLAPAPEAFAPISMPVHGCRPGIVVEYVPGKRAEIKDPDPLEERFCIAELVPIGGGNYRVVPRIALTWLRFGREDLRRIGVRVSQSTLHRLGRAGFINIRQISPSCYELDYQSWTTHCAAVEADPEFWDREVMTPAGKRTNRQRYLEAL